MSIRERISGAARSMSVASRQRRFSALGLERDQNGFTSSPTCRTILPQGFAVLELAGQGHGARLSWGAPCILRRAEPGPQRRAAAVSPLSLINVTVDRPDGEGAVPLAPTAAHKSTKLEAAPAEGEEVAGALSLSRDG